MLISAFANQAAAQAFADAASKALGYPSVGVSLGDGLPGGPFLTTAHDIPMQHPTSGAWIHRVGMRVRLARQQASVLAGLSAAEATALVTGVDAAADDTAIAASDGVDGQILAARVVLVADVSGAPSEPAVADVRTASFTVGSANYPVRVYQRSSDYSLFALQVVASGGSPRRWLLVAWAPSATRVASAQAFTAFVISMGAAIVKSWAVSQSGSQLVVPTLDSDQTAVGTAVKAVWPASWSTSGGAPRFIGDTIV